jgi:hypothetical protein
MMIPPPLTFAFEARVLVGDPVDMGIGTDGLRHRMIPITGGTVAGPRLNGVVLAGGADWQRIHPVDGLTELEARYVIQTDDGHAISVINRGLRAGSPEILQRLATGERVDPSLYYFRATPQFQTGSAEHAWLSRTVFLATGERWPGEVVIRFWAVG